MLPTKENRDDAERPPDGSPDTNAPAEGSAKPDVAGTERPTPRRLRRYGESVREDLAGAFGHLKPRRILALVVAVLIALYLSSGVYLVNPGEQAVERMFGRVARVGIGEGLHYRLPWPVQQVDKVSISEINREGVGMLLAEHEGVHSSPERLQVLTGDENIVDVQMIIQYRVSDPVSYLFSVDARPYQVVNDATRYGVTRIMGSMRVDDILTVAKEELQRRVQSETQLLLDAYGTGLSIVTVNIDKVYPPEEVADAFRDVSSAREDKLRAINQAEGYRNGLLPPAKGEAERLIREAEAASAEAVNRSSGEASRFRQMLAEYQISGGASSADVTRQRLYLETMERVLPRVRKYVVSTANNAKVNLRFISDE